MDNNEYRTGIITRAYRLRKSLLNHTPFEKNLEEWRLVWSGEQLLILHNNSEMVCSSVNGERLNEQIGLKKRLPAFVESWFNDLQKI